MADKEIVVKVTTEADLSNLEDLSGTIDAAKESADGLSESLDELSDADLAYLMGEIDDMPEGFYESTEAVDELSDSISNIDTGGLEDASSSADALSDSLDDIDGGGLDDASSSADDLADSLGGATESSNELSDSMGLIEGAMLLDVANQMSQIGSNAEGMAQDMNTAAISVGQLSTNVGMAEPQMVSLIANISNATFPQTEAMAYVNALNQMGVSADKLGESATNMDRINDATGIGYQSVMNLTAGLRSMGIEADNLPASFNAIAYAEANVYDGTNTLASTLRTQAGNLNEYGLSVDQVVVVLGALQSQTGLTGRKLSSELGSRLKECNGDIGALEQSLGLANGTLANASDLTGQYAGQIQALADEEAEHKSWLDQLNAAWEDMQLYLSPILSPLMSFAGIIGGFGSFAMQINGIITLAQTFGLLGSAESAIIPVQYAEAAAGWASIGWIALAIALGIALGLALVWLYENCDWFRQAVDALAGALQWLAGVIYENILSALQWLSDQFNQFTEQLGLNTDDWIQAILGFILFLPQLPLRVGIELANVIARALGFKGNFIQTLVSTATGAVKGFADAVMGIPRALESCLQWAYEIVMNNPLVQALQWLGEQAANAFAVIGLGQRSPGKIVKAMRKELDWTEDAIRDSNLAKVTAQLGQNITSEFGNTSLTNAITNMNGQGYRAGGDIIVNVYGDIDNDKRIRELVDAVRRELSWNNKTAGRTV